ncbi:hypothetical protein BB559_004109 [Furculomyces boomerangus]|uniref:Uncharacterized protein n=2 Tax=Harpellales TaxID=61421 RepID=A0A2T9YGN8_9FUNG|nr:hypothetical protein BB559_004109 [Furculomyces boomerangus]PVZ97445.1 hypothetical protein BB558_006608 [Smittium angustum]PVZ99320.1 hypothetical protein BB558_004658 [Smittium angustum]
MSVGIRNKGKYIKGRNGGKHRGLYIDVSVRSKGDEDADTLNLKHEFYRYKHSGGKSCGNLTTDLINENMPFDIDFGKSTFNLGITKKAKSIKLDSSKQPYDKYDCFGPGGNNESNDPKIKKSKSIAQITRMLKGSLTGYKSKQALDTFGNTLKINVADMKTECITLCEPSCSETPKTPHGNDIESKYHIFRSPTKIIRKQQNISKYSNQNSTETLTSDNCIDTPDSPVIVELIPENDPFARDNVFLPKTKNKLVTKIHQSIYTVRKKLLGS